MGKYNDLSLIDQDVIKIYEKRFRKHFSLPALSLYGTNENFTYGK